MHSQHTTAPAGKLGGRPPRRPLTSRSAAALIATHGPVATRNATDSMTWEEFQAVPAKVQAWLTLRAHGWTMESIAKGSGVKKETVHEALHGWDPNHRFSLTEEIRANMAARSWERVEQMALARVTPESIADVSVAQSVTIAAIARDKLRDMGQRNADQALPAGMVELSMRYRATPQDMVSPPPRNASEVIEATCDDAQVIDDEAHS